MNVLRDHSNSIVGGSGLDEHGSTWNMTWAVEHLGCTLGGYDYHWFPVHAMCVWCSTMPSMIPVIWVVVSTQATTTRY